MRAGSALGGQRLAIKGDGFATNFHEGTQPSSNAKRFPAIRSHIDTLSMRFREFFVCAVARSAAQRARLTGDVRYSFEEILSIRAHVRACV